MYAPGFGGMGFMDSLMFGGGFTVIFLLIFGLIAGLVLGMLFKGLGQRRKSNEPPS